MAKKARGKAVKELLRLNWQTPARNKGQTVEVVENCELSCDFVDRAQLTNRTIHETTQNRLMYTLGRTHQHLTHVRARGLETALQRFATKVSVS